MTNHPSLSRGPTSIPARRFAASEKYAAIRRAAWLGILGSGALGLMKLVAGILGNSHGVLADSVESLCDSVASVVVLVGTNVALRPPDLEHPYGHDRAEGVAGSTIATIMFISGILLAATNVQSLLQGVPQPLPETYTLWLMLPAVSLKGALFLYKLNVGRKTGSVAVTSDAWNDFVDILSGLVVLAGLFGARANIAWADRAAAIAVTAMILYTAVRLYLTAARAQLDQQAPEPFLHSLRTTAVSVPGVAGVEKLFARRAGLMYFVDLHLELPPDMPVSDAHRIGHEVKDKLLVEHEEVADVLVHIEPAKK